MSMALFIFLALLLVLAFITNSESKHISRMKRLAICTKLLGLHETGIYKEPDSKFSWKVIISYLVYVVAFGMTVIVLLYKQ